jgi:hypothetical protein
MQFFEKDRFVICIGAMDRSAFGLIPLELELWTSRWKELC